MAVTELFANQAAVSVTSGGTDAPASGAVETWTVASSSAFPAASSSANPPTQFHVCDTTLGKTGEIIAVTNVAGTTWTVTRGAESTTTVAHSAGFTVQQVTTAGFLGSVLQGMVYPSGDTSGAKDAAAINAAVTAVGTGSKTIYLAPGDWYLVPGAVTVQLANTQAIVIDGQWGAIINAVAGTAGDVIRMYNPNTQSPSGALLSRRSGIRGVTIDGTNATAGSTGLHIGDVSTMQLDVIIQNFSGAGDIGLHLDNSVAWTEEADARAVIVNCTSNVVFEVTTGYNSFGFGRYDFTIDAQPGQEGVVLKNGPYLYNAYLRIRGNFNASTTSAGNAVLKLTGTAPTGTPDAGTASSMYTTSVFIQVESDGTAAYPAQTVFIDTGCYMQNCDGIMSFYSSPNAFAASNIIVATNTNPFQFRGFNGIIAGDLNLNPAGGWSAGGPVLYTQANMPVYTGIAYPAVDGGDMFALTLTANTAVHVGSSSDHQAGPQRKTFIITQAASGGPYTVTWPANASPTTSATKVLWVGGTAPVMSTGASAVDMYELTTLDGATWIGRATQNVS